MDWVWNICKYHLFVAGACWAFVSVVQYIYRGINQLSSKWIDLQSRMLTYIWIICILIVVHEHIKSCPLS